MHEVSSWLVFRSNTCLWFAIRICGLLMWFCPDTLYWWRDDQLWLKWNYLSIATFRDWQTASSARRSWTFTELFSTWWPKKVENNFALLQQRHQPHAAFTSIQLFKSLTAWNLTKYEEKVCAYRIWSDVHSRIKIVPFTTLHRNGETVPDIQKDCNYKKITLYDDATNLMQLFLMSGKQCIQPHTGHQQPELLCRTFSTWIPVFVAWPRETTARVQTQTMSVAELATLGHRS